MNPPTITPKKARRWPWIVAAHVPCCGIKLAAVFAGVALPIPHNAPIEITAAILLPILGKYVADNYLHASKVEAAIAPDDIKAELHDHDDCCHPKGKRTRGEIVKEYAYWVVPSLALLALVHTPIGIHGKSLDDMLLKESGSAIHQHHHHNHDPHP